MGTWWRRGLALIVSASMVFGSMPAQALGEAVEEVGPTEDVAQVEAADEEPELEVAASEEAIPEDIVEEVDEAAGGQDQEQDAAAIVESDSGEEPSDVAPETVDSEVVLTTQGITAAEYWSRADAFINGRQGRAGDCYTYATDFVASVYGMSGPRSGSYFEGASNIRTGDVIYGKATNVNGTITDHWFVVWERNGNSISSAEGGYNGGLYVSSRYGISGNNITDNWGKGFAMQYGYHFDTGGATTRGNTSSFVSGIEAVNGVVGGIYLKGWTYNTANVTKPTQIHAYLDGGAGSSAPSWAIDADLARTDVDEQHHVGAFHGFETTLTGIPAGDHTVYLYANDQHLNQSQYIGSYQVTVTEPSFVSGIEAVNGVVGGIYLKGWTYNTANVTKPTQIHAYLDGGAGSSAPSWAIDADLARTDVDEQHHVGAFHGFETTLTGIPAGDHTVYLYANDQHLNQSQYIGTYQVTVAKNTQLISGTALYTKSEGDAPFALDATLTEGDGQLSYESSDPSVAAVDASGNVTVGLAGTATITITASETDAYNATSMEVVVSVRGASVIRVSTILLDSKTLELAPGQSKTLVATVVPIDATNRGVTWASTNKQVASVKPGGVVTAHKAGVATITAVANDGSGVTASCKVTVVETAQAPKPKPPAKVDIVTKSPRLASTSVVFSGAAAKPRVLVNGLREGTDFVVSYANNVAIGTATVTVTGKGGYTGTKRLTFKIVPGKASFKKAKAGTRSVTVQMKAQKGGVKYQVSYRTGKGKWKTVTTKKAKLVIKKLKRGKKYQVRVRAFKKVSGKTYYGAWSKAKTVKVK